MVFLRGCFSYQTTFLAVALVFLGPSVPQGAYAQSSKAKGSNAGGSKVLLKVPFEKQTASNLCGIAALEMIAGYYGLRLDQSQYHFLRLDADQNNGITGATMEVVLRASGYYTAIFKGTLDWELTGIYRDLDLKRPLIVMVTSQDRKTSHYGVVTGYDPVQKQIILSDPAGEEGEAFPEDQFIAGWKRANYFTLLAVPKKLGTPTP